MIDPQDTSRTTSEVERHAIGDLLLQRDMYSFSLQEVCEQDVRWVAAYVANDGEVSSEGTFGSEQYAAIDSRAPYAFLPYETSEIISGEDHGCGKGVSSGIAVIAKNEARAATPKTRGLTNADYEERLDVPFTNAQMQALACDYYFQAQANLIDEIGEEHFRSKGCKSEVEPSTLRGLACVQTTWRSLRATSCATHTIGAPVKPLESIRDLQIEAAGNEAVVFSENGPLFLGGDFNYRRHWELLESLNPALRKVTEGPTHRFDCNGEIDGIYVRGLNFSAPRRTNCELMDNAPAFAELRFGDFDGDDVTDVFHRHPSGQWRFSSGGVEPWQNLNRSLVPGDELRFGDLDGDGATDVFHRYESGQWRFSSAGVESWQNLNRSLVPGDELRFGYFDGDRRTDVFHRHPSGQWRFSSGAVGPWQNLNRSLVPGSELRFGDFDGDHVTDVFHRHESGQWRFSSGGVRPWQNLNGSGVPGDELRFGYFDGDRVTDVFHRDSSGQWRFSSGGRLTWQSLNGSTVDELHVGDSDGRHLGDLGGKGGDFNGDGLTDVFSMTRVRVWQYSPSATGGWSPLASVLAPLDPADPFSWSDHALLRSPGLTPATRTKSDFDGDGVADVFNRDSDGQWRFSSGGLLQWRDLNHSVVPGDELRFGDFDGDRRTDVFHRDSSGQWRFSSGGLLPWQNLNRSVAPRRELRFGDFDGDGVTDVFHRDSDGQWRFSSGAVEPWQNLNRSLVPGSELRFGDFDGDGATDVFHRHESGRWRFSSAGVAPWRSLNRSTVPGDELRFGDFDGDGVTDVFHRHESGQWRFSSGGRLPWRNLNRSAAPGSELRFADIDGDGVTDVFHRDSDGQWRFSKSGRGPWRDLNHSIVPGDELLFEE